MKISILILGVVLLGASLFAFHHFSGRGALVRPTGDETFDQDVLAAAGPTVVEYWAHGCFPCFQLAPHVEKLAHRYAGQVSFWKLNMGWNAARVYRYHVRSVPTLVFYKNGREVARQAGNTSDSELQNFVEAGLRASP